MSRIRMVFIGLVLLVSLVNSAQQDDAMPTLHVSEVVPVGGTREVPTDAVITAIFDRPVVPLIIVEDMASLPQPLTISPEVAGEGEWVNTFVYSFTPDEPLPANQEFTVQVDETLTTHDGAVLDAPYSWSFATTTAKIIRMNFHDGTGYKLDPTMAVYFNMPVQTSIAEEYISLRPVLDPYIDANTANALMEDGILPQTDEAIPCTIEWYEDRRIVYFTPDRLLKNETTYVLQVDRQRLKEKTGIDLNGQIGWAFSTNPYPQVISTVPEDQSTTDDYSGFTIEFNTYMDSDSINERLTIDPEQKVFNGYRSGFNYRGMFREHPSTTYTIHIDPGIEDIYGNVYDQPIDLTYTTESYPPRFDLRVPRGPVAFYNAYQPETGILLEHRNVKEVGVQLYTLEPENFMRLMFSEDREHSIYNYQPPASTLLYQWREEIPYTENATEKALLSLNARSACNHALETELSRGDIVRMEQDFDILSYPVEGLKRFTALQGMELSIKGGPICTNADVWWQVEVGGEVGWLPEIQDGQALVQYVRSAQETRLHVTDDDAALQPGIYFLRVIMRDPAPTESFYETHTMLVMTANLTMKLSHDNLLIWATDVNTGEPLPNVPVMIYDGQDLITAGVTDADGLLSVEVDVQESLTYEQYMAVIDTDQHFGMGLSGWADGIDPGNFGHYADFYTQDHRYEGTFYLDRQAYRPGETVYYRGIVRARDDMTYTVPTEEGHVVVTIDGGGDTHTTITPDLTPYGTFSVEYVILDNPGTYSISTSWAVPGQDQPEYLESSYIYVSEFRLPEYSLTAAPVESDVAQNEPLEIAVAGEYYSGGPVSMGDVHYHVISSPAYFRYVGEEPYSFSIASSDDAEYNREIIEDDAVMDRFGSAVLDIPTDLGKSGMSQRFDIEITVNDETNQAVSTQTSATVHAGMWYIGSRPEQYVNYANEETTINMIMVDWDSVGVAEETVDVAVVRREWFSVQESDANGATAWVWDYNDVSVDAGTVTTDAEGKAIFTFEPDAGGTYIIIFSTQDTLGNAIMHQARVWVSSSEYVPWRMQNNNRIDLVLNQDDYHVGDVAEILIASPFQNPAYALVTVERKNMMSSEVIYMENNSFVHKIAIEEDFAPNVFVSVMIVSNDAGVPAFRMGMAQLTVDIEQKMVQVDIEVDRERAQPGETVTYTIHTTDYAGNPIQTELDIALTEKPALDITGPYKYDHAWLLQQFYRQQWVSVRTSTPLTINTEQLMREILDYMKGGGGGYGYNLPTLYEVRSNFVSTPYFNGSVMTDENGVATVEITLPDNLTTWMLNVHALTDGDDGITRLGYGTSDLISTRPLIVRPATPRFMVVGDALTLGAVVNNNSTHAQQTTVTLEADGVELHTEASQTVVIPAGERVRVDWPVTVEDVDAVELIFRAESDEYVDATRPTLGTGDLQLIPVYRYEVTETVATSGILRDAGTRTESIQLPAEMAVQEGELNVEVQGSLASITLDNLDYLRLYPYYCTEQTVSRFLPNIMTYRALESLDQADPQLRTQLEYTVETALQKLYTEQKVDGGWGWYMAEESSPLTTAYALIGLTEARNQGFYVHDSVINGAIGFLDNNIIPVSYRNSDGQLNRQAFILYALARAESPNIAASANLFEHRERLSLDAQAYLALTFHMINPEDTLRTDTLLANFDALAITSATGTYWEELTYDRWNWGTSNRTNALILQVMVDLNPESERIPNMVRWLLDQRVNRYWSTTQETAWSVMALTDWMLISGDAAPDYTYDVTFNGDQQLSAVASTETIRETRQLILSIQDMLVEEANTLSLSRSDGPGTLYYTAHMSLNLPVPEVDALDRGIVVQRQFYRQNADDTLTPVTEAHIGDLIEVHLTLVAPHALHYVNVEAPIPAGVEPIDPRIMTNQKFGTQPSFSRSSSRWGWNWWWFSNIEFHDEKVTLSSSYLPAGTYEFVYMMRPVMVGEFNVIPAMAYEFYYPEVHGRSDGLLFSITE